MRKQLFVLGVVALVALLATSAFAANRGVSFSGIGFIHPWDPGPYPASMVWGMTDDGATLLTSPSWSGSYATLTTYPGLEWTLVGAAGSYEISGDGTAIFAGYLPGDDGNTYSGYWNGSEDDWTLFPMPASGFEPCGGSYMSYYGMGGSGDYATGLTWVPGCSARPWLWDAATNTTVILPSPYPGDESSRPNAITDDGTMIAGFGQKECGSRRGAIWVNGTPDWIDGLGENEAKLCGADGSACCGDRDCPDYVDALCTNTGSCDKTGVYCDRPGSDPGVCVGGATPGASCYGSWNCKGLCTTGPNTGGACGGDYECPGTCDGGPNNGEVCTGNCPDFQVCFDNPDFSPETEKGEAYSMTPDGSYIAGERFGQSPYDWSDPLYDPYLWASGWRRNPDGSFTKLEVPEGVYPDGQWLPIDMSDDGSVIGGKFGSFWSSYPVLWTEETGTLDMQYFLVAQGLDDLYFWFIQQVNTVRADGAMVGGTGTNYVNPDCHSQWGCTEGWVAEIAKASVCHKDDSPAERTLTIGWDSIGNHLGHGDQLGTCEFWEEGGARAADFAGNRNSADHDPSRIISYEQGQPLGDEWTPDQGVQQDDEVSSPGPAVQRDGTRKRTRR